MKGTLLSNESLLRLAAFAGALAAMEIWELLARRRPQQIGRGWRWPNNLAVIAIDTLLVRLVFPMTPVCFAVLAESRGWGLLQALSVPIWLAAHRPHAVPAVPRRSRCPTAAAQQTGLNADRSP